MKEENVYYDKKVKQFVQIRGTKTKGYMVGGHSEYYADAITNILQDTYISEGYFKLNLVKVEGVDKFAEHNGIGWKIKTME